MAKTLGRLAAALCLLLWGQANPAVAESKTASSGAYPNLARIAASRPATMSGQSATQLPDGRWLLLGGSDPEHGALPDAKILDLKGSQATPLAHGLLSPRSGHTATLMPDGTVLVLGGVDTNGNLVDVAEQFSPATGRLAALDRLGLVPRVYHSATVLADGRLLIAGGVDGRGTPVYDAELYNPVTHYAEHFDAKLQSARLSHLAALLPSSKVLLWGGLGDEQSTLTGGELFDPVASGFEVASAEQAERLAAPLFSDARPAVLSTVPIADATDVPVDQRLTVRFSKRVAGLNEKTVTLLGPAGLVTINVVPVEEGSLLFVTPQQQLLPASRYTLFIKGATDLDGRALPFTAIGWATAALVRRAEGATIVTGGETAAAASPPTKSSASTALTQPQAPSGTQRSDSLAPDSSAGLMQEEWHPGTDNFKGNWRSRRPASQLQALPPLMAPEGTTALSGQVLTLHGLGLANVTLRLGARTAQTDESGRFLIKDVSAGTGVLTIGGRTDKQRGGQYGFYTVKVKIADKETNVLNYKIWLSKLDLAGTAVIASPTVKETIVSTPRIPGLELHLPPGTVIRDPEGKIVTELNMTAIPTDRPPFPIPDVGVPVYFTIQPGGAVIENISGSKLHGARLIYPNFSGAAPGTRIDFWNYDAREKGWYIYGRGTVTQNGKQIVPDQGVAIYEFSGAMVSVPGNAPPDGPPCNPCSAGDPVDVYTGLFLHESLDLRINDVIPIEVKRSYRPRDTRSRAFGVGANLSYDLFIVGDIFPYTYVDLILPNGGRINFPRTSPGTGYTDAVFTHPPTGSIYDGATISYTGGVCYWSMKLKDGMQICFPEAMGATNPREAAATRIKDRHGNTVLLTRDNHDNLVTVKSPSGRSLQFTYDTSNRITQATDNIGRQSSYEYDSGGHLVKATLPDGSFEAYTYDSNGNMVTVQDQRGNVMVTNSYDANNRVSKQTYADGKTNQLQYSLDASGKASQVDVTNERGVMTRYVFDSTGSPTSITRAQGLPEQQTVRFERDAKGQLLSKTDALGRKTSFTYDANGNVISKTQLVGTAEETKVTMEYTGDFNDPASITDPVGHKSVFSYDAQGHLTQVTDPNGNLIRFAYGANGLLTQVTNPLGKVYANLYDGADLVSTTDPLNRSTNFDVDAVGRGIGLTNGNGNRTAFNYDQFDRMVQVVDPAGQGTTKQFDANGNPTAILDAKGNSHQYAYDARNRQIAYTDPLQQTERYGYDGTGNLVNYTDRKGQVTKYTFDNLDRLALITYADGSTVTYRYDQGNRPVQIVDSVNGTIKYAYDSYDRITTETTPKGAVSYTYYPNGLRKTMTVSGQPTVRYAYDTGDRLLRIDQDAGASNNNLALSVAFTYDAANRRTQTTLPNGTTQNYSYDDAGQLTRIVYRGADGSELGDLSYSYDAAGQRIKTGGSLARTRLTDDVSSATVDAANRLTSWGGGTLTYDANGNLISDGTISYVWNARNKLTQIKGANGSVIATFEYDALGRRMSKVVNGQAVGYMYDGLNVVQALAGANVGNSDPGNVLANYLTGFALDELFAATARSGGSVRVRNYLTDALGSTVRLADAAGAKVADYTYEPYGSTSADGVDANPFQFTGRENDGTGLYYYRARYYSSKWARFISSDPIGLKGGTNTYAYARGNPVGKTDPLGLTEWSGRITNFGVSLPAGAGGQIITYRMTSKCVRGQRWIVDGQATMGAMGLGKSPIGQTDTLATFEDYLDYVNPYVFNGPALTYSAGSVALGPGYSVVGKLELGGAFADISGSQTGVDATYIQAGMGSSKVLNAKTETCGCQ